jgi:GNAT superfamily N-acetyltransferase
MLIRQAREWDIPELLNMAVEFEEYLLILDNSLIQEVPPKQVFEEYLRKGFKDRKHFIIVAEEDNSLIGFADFWAYPEFMHGGMVGYMNNIFVRKAHRGKGVGRLLIEKIMDEARQKKVVAMHVPVKTKNPAVDFYIKMGIDEKLFMMETRLD